MRQSERITRHANSVDSHRKPRLNQLLLAWKVGRICLLTGYFLLCEQEVAKKRTRRAVKSQRGIVGASLDVIKERRNQRPEARAAARQQAIKDAKEKKAAAESRKKAEKAKTAATKPAQRIQSKQGAKGSAPKVAAKSR